MYCGYYPKISLLNIVTILKLIFFSVQDKKGSAYKHTCIYVFFLWALNFNMIYKKSQHFQNCFSSSIELSLKEQILLIKKPIHIYSSDRLEPINSNDHFHLKIMCVMYMFFIYFQAGMGLLTEYIGIWEHYPSETANPVSVSMLRSVLGLWYKDHLDDKQQCSMVSTVTTLGVLGGPDRTRD